MDVFEDPQRKTKQVNFLLTPKEKERLDEAARQLDMTVAELIREAVNHYVRLKMRKKS